MRYPIDEAVRINLGNRETRTFPDQAADPRVKGGSLYPDVTPRFKLSIGPGSQIFTIGSCFARNVEEALQSTGVTLPTLSYSGHAGEWHGRPNGLLNEFTPGTMAQRILHALSGRAFPESTIVPTDKGSADLLLVGGADVTFARAAERRAQIDAIYGRLRDSQAVIITLGYVESWFDEEAGVYLNRMPPWYFGKNHPKRFTFIRLTAEESVGLLEPAMNALADHGIKVVLTVSPVPLNYTFTGTDCIVANEYSKSALRVCADMLYRRCPNVDYFPSYEIVRSGGLTNFIEDRMHVRDDVVRAIVGNMLERYRDTAAAAV